MQIRLAIRPNPKVATIAVSMYWTTPLEAEKLAAYALIPFLIRRGSIEFPETADLRQQFEWRYGMRSNMDLQQRGNAHVMSATMSMVDPAHVQDPDYSVAKALRFWMTQWMNPALEPGDVPAFRSDYLKQEKLTIERRIASLKNDPISYASDRTARLTLRHQAQRHSIWGEAADLAKWDGATLYQEFLAWRERASIDVYVHGNVDSEQIAAIFSDFAVVNRVHVNEENGLIGLNPQENDANGATLLAGIVRLSDQPTEPTIMEWEESASDQLKLNLAFELPVTRDSDQFTAGLMLNGVFGGYAHSKLFQNVREKASLAYYASSRWDSLTQRLIVQTGIAPTNENRARELILEQLRAMENGQIDADEWTQTIALLKNSMREREDDVFTWSEAMQMNRWTGSAWTTEKMIASIQAVQIEDVAALAKKLRLDLVYRYGKQPEPLAEQAHEVGDRNE